MKSSTYLLLEHIETWIFESMKFDSIVGLCGRDNEGVPGKVIGLIVHPVELELSEPRDV